MFKVAASGLGCLAHIWRISQIPGLCPLEGFAFKCPEDSSCAAPHGGAFECSKLSEGVQTLSVSVQGLGCKVKRSLEKVILRSSWLDVKSCILTERDVKKSCFGARGLM